MDIPVSEIPFNFTNCSTCLPEVAQTELSGSLWNEIYMAGVSVVATPANLIVIVCLWKDPSAEISGFPTYAVSVAFTDLLHRRNMETAVSMTPFNFTNCSTSLPGVAQTDFSVPVWHHIYTVCVSVVATAANLIVIVCLWRDPSSKVSGFTTYAVSMAFTDLLVGVVLMPFRLMRSLWAEQVFGLTVCILWKLVDYGVTSVSMLLFLAMGYDRYRCVTAPLQYRSQFRTTQITRMCVCVWIGGFILWTPYTLLKVLLNERKSFDSNCPVFIFRANVFEAIQVTIAFCIPLTALIIMNSVLLWTLNTRISLSRKSAANGRQIPGNISTVSDTIGHHSRPCRHVMCGSEIMASRKQVSKKRHSRNASSYKIVIVVVIFCVFWMPYFIAWPVNGLCRTCITDEVTEFCGFFTYGQSAINPLIVISTSRRIRSRITRACVCLSRSK
ncbi:octopamine receptor beta-2R-like [Liolophura sinensis]|uniref:octopamine receptor beta-2R-like n=1 Tax=Liolophura sinensis TaxID=3198878 RepID=UPI00315905CF